jgi:hypothetical protein
LREKHAVPFTHSTPTLTQPDGRQAIPLRALALLIVGLGDTAHFLPFQWRRIAWVG